LTETGGQEPEATPVMHADDYEELPDRRHSGTLAESSGQDENPTSEATPPDALHEEPGQAAPDAPVLPSLHIHTVPSTPFQAASLKPAEDKKGNPFATAQSQRPRAAKAGHDVTIRRVSSGPQPRQKTTAPPPHRSTRAPEHSFKPPINPHKSTPSSKATSHLPSNKSVLQLQKASIKGDKSKAKMKATTGAMQRSVSSNELQPQKALTSETSGLGTQKSLPASKRILQKLTPAPLGATKAPIKLPTLAPTDIKILAAVGQRDWIKIDSKGERSVVKKDKQAMTHELGIQIRDLRLLDPLMTSAYPSAILCRDKALVVNLEYIKCIITRDCTLILDVDQVAVKAFVQQLQLKVTEKMDHGEEGGLEQAPPGGNPHLQVPVTQVPHELRVLEAALDNICKHLESLYFDLDVNMRPMLGTHTASKVTSDYLERMRRLKTKLVRLKTRVETLRGVLDKVLSDESDMKAIHLTGKMREQRAAVQQRLVRRSLRDAMQNPQPPSPVDTLGNPSPYLPPQDMGQEDDEREVAEVEMLLGAYYMNLDSIWNKLTDISEFVDDAEELMDLEMDTFRNNIIKVQVFLNLCHLMAGAIFAVANFFGMNLGLLYNNLDSGTHSRLLQVIFVTVGGSLLAMFTITFALHFRQLGITTIMK